MPSDKVFAQCSDNKLINKLLDVEVEQISEEEKKQVCNIIMCVIYSNLDHTSVLSFITTLNFCKILTTAIFNSSKASLIPIQCLGPFPKGI